MTDTNALADELEAELAACEREGVTFKAGWNLIRATIAALRTTDHPTAEDYRNRAEWAEAECAEKDAEIARLREALAKDATRFEVCAVMIAETFNASGTLRAERTEKARHFALESLHALGEQQ